jgi:serine protease
MRTIFSYIILLLFVTSTFAQSHNRTLVVKLKPQNNRTNQTIEKALNIKLLPIFKQHHKLRNTKQASRLSNIYAVNTNEQHLKPIISYLKNHTEVEYVEFKPEVKLFETPNDPGIASQYYIDITNMFNAWDIETGDTTIVIGIVDTGTDFTHDELDGKVALNYNDPINGEDDDQDGFIDNYYGWDLSENNNNTQYDANYHGAKMAATIAACTNNGIGIAGVGYNLKYLPIKTMNSQGDLNTAWEGIIYAADHGADIIVCSWGGIVPSSFGRDIVQYAAIDKGALLVAAAGNDNNEIPFYPACYPEVVSVAGTNQNDQKWTTANGGGSTYGYTVDISAPGQDIYNINPNNSYGIGSGTSYAAPIVGAIAGLIKSNRPHLNAEQIKQQLFNTSYLLDTIPQNVVYAHKLGAGRVDAYQALSDTMISGVALSNVLISGNPVAGDTIFLTGTFTNHLKSAVINISIASLHADAFPLTSSINAGIMNTNSTYEIDDNEIPIILSESMEFDQQVTIKFTINDGIKTYYRLHTFAANNSYNNITNNNLNATVASNGRIGFSDLDPITGNGIWLDNTQNIIWEAGLIYGNSNTQTISTFMGANPLKIEKGVSMSTDIYGNTHLYAEMNDTNKTNSMDIYVKHKVSAINDVKMDNTLLYEYTLINNSQATYDNFHAGIYLDWDLKFYDYNHIYMNEDHQIAICESIFGDENLVGVKLLDFPFHQYAFEIADDTEGINITDNFTNEERWFALSNERNEAGIGLGDNVSHMISTDALTLEAGDSINLKFIITAAYHESNIITQIQDAEQYVSILPKWTQNKEQITSYPNPFKNQLHIHTPTLHEKLVVMNSKGQIVLTLQPKSNKIAISLDNYPAGLYLIKTTDKKGKEFSSKIMKRN